MAFISCFVAVAHKMAPHYFFPMLCVQPMTIDVAVHKSGLCPSLLINPHALLEVVPTQPAKSELCATPLSEIALLSLELL